MCPEFFVPVYISSTVHTKVNSLFPAVPVAPAVRSAGSIPYGEVAFAHIRVPLKAPPEGLGLEQTAKGRVVQAPDSPA